MPLVARDKVPYKPPHRGYSPKNKKKGGGGGRSAAYNCREKNSHNDWWENPGTPN